MIKPVTFLRLASAAVLSLPLLAQAAGLGRMSVQSFLGQPLRAEIQIVAVQAGEEASLEARLASGNAFAQAGIEFSPALTSVQFAIERREGRPTVLRVTSRQPVNEPFLDLLVELRWDSGLLVREYTVVLDPPEYRGLKPAVSAPGATARAEAAPAVAAPVATPVPTPTAPAPAAEPSSATRAAREDDLAARERALKEAQSRVGDLEKNVSDLQKLVEMRNQQLADLQNKAAATPAPISAATAPEPPKPAPAPQAAKAPEAKPAAPAPAQPVSEPPSPVAAAPKPVAEAPKPAAAEPKPRPVQAPPPPESSLVDEFLDNPIALGGLVGVVLLLGGYGAWTWKRKKKATGSKFQDSVLGAPSVAPGGVVGDVSVAPGGTPSVSPSSVSQASVAGMDADDVDPIAEADVYMAYGRDAQAEEILKEALRKDANRIPVHAKLLEIYANRRDAQSFEQGALQLRGLTKGSGPDWDKAVKLGRSIDPGNGLYGGTGEAPAAAAPVVAATAPTVDFDIGGGASAEAAASAPGLDLDLGGGAPATSQDRSDFSPSGTLIIDSTESKAASSGLDFDLGTSSGVNFNLPASAPAAAAPAASAPAASGGLDFDLNLGGGDAPSGEPSAPAMDLSEISLDLGTPGETPAAGAGADDPKWQEVATKFDLAKAYEEMGDKDGARELLNEVAREGDAAQQAQANQMLAKLG